LLYATIFHLLAGAATGSIFKFKCLSILLGIVLVESALLAHAHGYIAALWAIANLTGIQVGYLIGLAGRGALEQAGYVLPIVRPRRMP
jgi:hypothetical protein